MLKELIKVIQLVQHYYKDPLTEFLKCLYANLDFDGAKKLMEREQMDQPTFIFVYIRQLPGAPPTAKN
ncbi:hypothetical protein EJB05_42598, partial [Eragrostis curvula]